MSSSSGDSGGTSMGGSGGEGSGWGAGNGGLAMTMVGLGSGWVSQRAGEGGV